MSAEPADFWDARPVLKTIQQWARSRRVGPWSLLGAILATVVSRVDPKVSLPAIVGGRGSINFYAALVGVSGGGKSASISTGHDALDVRADRLYRWEQRSLGSGEGLSAAFVERIKGENGSEIVHHTDGVLAEAPEVDQLAALGSRSGATLMPELRKAWVGEGLGFQNRDRSTSLPVAAHSYRLGLILGVQPARSAALLDDAAGGTPQRFVWFSTEDPDAPAKAPTAPAPIKWQNPGIDVLPEVDGVRYMQVCDVAWETIEQAALARLRGDVHALDGHALFSRLKVAAGLSLLEMRGGVNESDWELAGFVMQHSDQTRDVCRNALRAVSREANETRAELRAEAVVRADDHMVAKCQERIMSKLGTEWIAERDIKNSLSRQLRDNFDTAVLELISDGKAEAQVDDYQGRSRTRYRLAQGSVKAESPTLPTYPVLPHEINDPRVGNSVSAESPTLASSAHLDRVCPGCGTSLSGRRPQTKTCSERCRKRVARNSPLAEMENRIG